MLLRVATHVSNPFTPLNFFGGFDHGETICPTGPKRGVWRPRGAPKAQPAQQEWDSGNHLASAVSVFTLRSLHKHAHKPACGLQRKLQLTLV